MPVGDREPGFNRVPDSQCGYSEWGLLPCAGTDVERPFTSITPATTTIALVVGTIVNRTRSLEADVLQEANLGARQIPERRPVLSQNLSHELFRLLPTIPQGSTMLAIGKLRAHSTQLQLFSFREL